MTAHASMAKTKHDAATGHSRGHSVAMHDSYKRQPVPTGAAKPLAPALSEEMGRRFSEDFDSVRLHEGADARAGADALDARAYTFGEHIVLGRAAAPPDTAEGKRTLAHELAHVVQQRRGGPPPALSADAPHEHGAERAAGMFVSGTGAVSVTGATGIGVARDPVDDVKKRKGAAKPKAKSTKLPGVDAKTDAAVEKGIVEEPTAQPPPKAPKTQKVKTTQEAKDARKKFNTKRDKHAQSLSVAKGGQVHHGVELQALKRYPGAFTAEELNAPGNMRGIRPELEGKRQLHNSKVREVWDRHYNNLDAQLKAKGLKKGTPAFRAFARKFLLEARAEMDHLYGQFYSESHAAEAAKSKKQTTKQGATKPKSATKQAPKKASKPGAKQSGQASKASAGKSKPAAKTSSKQKPKAQAKPAATPSSKSLSKAGPTPPKAAAKPASKLPSKAPSQSKPAVKAAQQAAKAQPKSTAIPPPKAKPAAAPKAPVSKAAVKAPPPKAVMSAPVPQALPKSAPKNIPKSSPPAKSGGVKGGAGGIAGFGLQIIAGLIHQKAVEKRVDKQSDEQGFVPHDAPSGEGLAYDLGAWLLDPMRDAEKNVDNEKRFKISPWRQKVRNLANSKASGESFDFTWEDPYCGQDLFGRPEVKYRYQKVTYKKGANGRLSVESGNASGTLDLNDVISEEISDEEIDRRIPRSTCGGVEEA